MNGDKLNEFPKTVCKSDNPNHTPNNKNHETPKRKKSYSLLSAIVRRTKRKKKQKVDDNGSDLNCVSSSSTFCSNYADKMASEGFKSGNSVKSTESEPLLETTNKTKNKFFSKFLVKHGSTEIEKQSLDNIGDDAQSGNKGKTIDERNNLDFTISFINFKKPTLSASLVEGLISLQNLTSRLEQSEKYLLDVFKRYVSDITLQKELIDTLGAHSSLHRETERLTRHLSTEMWSKQLEIEKGQQNTLQDALESVIKQNRQLLVEYEDLFLTYEKLLNKFQGLVENSDLNEKECGQEIKEVMKHNIELINKMENVCKQIEQFENELIDSKKQNGCLGDQLTKVSGQLHDLEAVFQRAKTDYELEVANLNRFIQSKEKIILEIKHSCNVFKQEVESVKDQLNGFSYEIDWLKFKSNEEENLHYIIDVGHLCIKNLTKDVANLGNELNIKEQNIENLLEDNRKLQENPEALTDGFDTVNKKIDNGNHILSEPKTDIEDGADKYERLKFNYEMDKNCLIKQIQYYEEMQNKSQILYNQVITYINNLTSENLTLKKQMDEMINILQENSEKKNIFSHKENSLHKAIFTSEQFNQILFDKQNLLKQQELLTQEYQKQQTEIAHLSKDNKALLEKFDAERKTVISLQNERKNYLQERSLLKVIFEHMKNELTRLQKLEDTISDVSNEANKLAIVAEYNKEIGKKLKAEIEEKDKTIITLRNTVEHLNDIQLKNTKEKLSLCFELSELSQMKDNLDNQLSNVVKKNEALDEAKQNILQSTNIQLEKIEKIQKKERIAFKELLKDMKIVTRQRNALLKEREITIKELETMKNLIEDYAMKIDKLLSIKEENEYKLKNLLQRHDEDDLKICKMQDKLRLETKSYEENVKQLEKLIFELRKEETEMEDSIKYLKNNSQKLYNDLNLSRSNEKELKDALNTCLSEKKSFEEAVIKSGQVIASLAMDKERLSQELHKSNQFCEKVLSDLEKSLTNAVEKEELLKKELDEKKDILLRSDIKNEQLIKEVLDKKEEMIRLQEDIGRIRLENIQFQEKIDHFSTIRLNVLELTEKLEQEKTSYAALSDIHKEISSKFIESVKKNVEEKEARLETEKQLKQVKEELEKIPTEKVIYLEENAAYQDEIKVITVKNEKLKKECQENQNLIFSLRQDIAQYQQQLIGLEFQKSEVTLRLHELQKKYETQVNLCDQLQNIQKVILDTIYKLRENELIDQEQCSSLISIIRI